MILLSGLLFCVTAVAVLELGNALKEAGRLKQSLLTKKK